MTASHQSRLRVRLLVAAAALVALAPAAEAATEGAQRPEPRTQGSRGPTRNATPPGPASGEIPVSLERIREALAQAPQSRLRLPERPTFFVEIEERAVRVEDFLDIGALRLPPAPATPAWHREFLDLVTPPLARPYASFSPGELGVVAATSILSGIAANTIPSLIKDAVRRRREEAARREVQEVRAELERRRREAAASHTAPPEAVPPPSPPSRTEPPRN